MKRREVETVLQTNHPDTQGKVGIIQGLRSIWDNFRVIQKWY